MEDLVGKTIHFDDQEVMVYYYDEYIDEYLIYNDTLGLTWVKGMLTKNNDLISQRKVMDDLTKMFAINEKLRYSKEELKSLKSFEKKCIVR